MERAIRYFGILIILVIALTGCADIGLQNHWSALRRSQLVPVADGMCFYSEQDIFGLLASDGQVLWSKEIEGSRRVTLKKFGNFYYVLGDNDSIERIDINGNQIWKLKAPSGSSFYLVASSQNFLIAAFDQDTSYPLNNIELIALSVVDGSELWRLSDRDYQSLLLLPPQNFLSEIIIAPYIRGTTAWVDGLSVKDGKQLWKSIHSIPRSGYPFVLAQTESRIWLWQAKDEGIEAFVLDRGKGTIVGHSVGASFSMVDYSFVRDKVFVFFKGRTFSIDENGVYTEFKSKWLPISFVPSVANKLVVLESNCGNFGIMDELTMKVEEGFKLPVCYFAVPGMSPGEFYLIPEVAPFDHQAFKMTYLTKNEFDKTKTLDNLDRLGKNKTLFDVIDSIRKIKP